MFTLMTMINDSNTFFFKIVIISILLGFWLFDASNLYYFQS